MGLEVDLNKLVEQVGKKGFKKVFKELFKNGPKMARK